MDKPKSGSERKSWISEAVCWEWWWGVSLCCCLCLSAPPPSPPVTVTPTPVLSRAPLLSLLFVRERDCSSISSGDTEL